MHSIGWLQLNFVGGGGGCDSGLDQGEDWSQYQGSGPGNVNHPPTLYLSLKGRKGGGGRDFSKLRDEVQTEAFFEQLVTRRLRIKVDSI